MNGLYLSFQEHIAFCARQFEERIRLRTAQLPVPDAFLHPRKPLIDCRMTVCFRVTRILAS